MLNAGIVHDDVKPPNEELKTFSIISRIVGLGQVRCRVLRLDAEFIVNLRLRRANFFGSAFFQPGSRTIA
jgi:hypothetical protein